MYVYIDESGNTGDNLFDPIQPYFYAGALITKGDFDEACGAKVKALAECLGVDALHASELNKVGKLEEILPSLLNILKTAETSFILYKAEKHYIGYMHFMETYFDGDYNKGVSYEWCVSRPHKLYWLLNLYKYDIITDDCLKVLWKCFSSKKQDLAEKYFIEGAKLALERCKDIGQEDIRKLTIAGLNWAIAHPQDFASVRQPEKRDYRRSPNYNVFTGLLGLTEVAVHEKNETVKRIIHDEQLLGNLKEVLEWHHAYFSQAEFRGKKGYIMNDHTSYPLGVVTGSKFEMKADQDSAGLQVVDILIWLHKRKIEKKSLSKHSEELLDWATSSTPRYGILSFDDAAREYMLCLGVRGL